MAFLLELEGRGDGTVRATAADPQDSFSVFRLKRTRINSAPEKPGVYFLMGHGSEGEPRVYVGQSETDIRKRLKDHRKNKKLEFFGEIFVFPLEDTVYCRAVESEFIARGKAADNAVVLANIMEEKHSLGAHPAATLALCEKIQTALAMLWGEDVFSEEAAALPEVTGEGAKQVESPKRVGITIADLLSAKKLEVGQTLFAPLSDQVAHITEDGTIEMNGEEYTALSGAAAVANASIGRTDSVNGWLFWEVDVAEGRVKLDVLRQALKKTLLGASHLN